MMSTQLVISEDGDQNLKLYKYPCGTVCFNNGTNEEWQFAPECQCFKLKLFSSSSRVVKTCKSSCSDPSAANSSQVISFALPYEWHIIIKDYRRERNLTQKFVAYKLGVDKSTISRWENELVGPPNPDQARLLEFILEIPHQELQKAILEFIRFIGRNTP